MRINLRTLGFMLIGVGLGVLFGFTVAAIDAAQCSAKQRPHVVAEKWHKPPAKVKKAVRFTPTARPSVEEVFEIAAHEQRRWGGPSLLNRIHCESTYQWNVSNGQYRGLLQFGPIWDSMFPGTPLGVKVVERRTVTKRIVRFRKWSHLKDWVRKPRARVKQRVYIVKRGRIPANADPYHGWAAIRVGQRAVSGDGPTTGWECGL